MKKRPTLLAAACLALSLGWTMASGFENPPPRIVSDRETVHLSLPYRGVCSDVTLFRDGQPVPTSKKKVADGLAGVAIDLPPGEHDLTVQFQGAIPGSERLYPLVVEVDKTPPKLEGTVADSSQQSSSELLTTEDTVRVTGRTEPDAGVFIGGARVETDERGNFEHVQDLNPGWNHLLVLSRDPAGNKRRVAFNAFKDTGAPEFTWRTKPDQVFKTEQARLKLDLSDDDRVVALSGQIDQEQSIDWYAKGDGFWVGKTSQLHQGYNQISAKATDRVGRIATTDRRVVVDSSENLGEAVLGLGARGQDVEQLHDRLTEEGFLAGEDRGSVFNETTESALRRFQQTHNLPVTGMVDGETLAAVGPRLIINLSRFSLVLERPGKDPLSWRIARGSAEHSTPSGRFHIAEKVVNPRWLPPKSEWAKDAEVVPPGPDNPLGTRWLGFNRGGVGIHGTNAPWTVGTASSHGCMRMVTGQVEKLFEMVSLGTPVIVLQGNENDPLVQKYWPRSLCE